ncbi:hypothetical protein Tco_1544597, partial [Tanacetum coccineum]
MDAGLFCGIPINGSLTISNLFYADDAVFVGKWDMSNINTLVYVLKCFHMASGLQINMHKSKIIGIGVHTEGVDLASKIVGCSTFSSPFTHLGVKVGGVMSRIKTWDDVISKVSSRLSKWKLKTLSIGGRLTLIKYVLSSIPLYYMSIFKVPMGVLTSMESIRRNFFNGIDGSEKKMAMIKWDKVLASKKYGGLGVSSFFAFNRALLFKWIWQFLTQPSSLWVRFIKAIYGDKGAIDSFDSISRRSPWLDIIRESSSLTNKGIDFMDFVRKKVGNGEDSLFFEDNWLNNTVLKHQFPRLFALESSKQITVADKLRSESLDTSYRRAPRVGIEEEQQQLLRSHIE